MPKAIELWDDSSTLFLDDASMDPMPESVSKQFVSRLFNISNLNVFYDLPINQGFEDWEFFEECENSDSKDVSREEALKAYTDMFKDLEYDDTGDTSEDSSEDFDVFQ